MPRLSQILGVEAGLKNRTNKVLFALNRRIQVPALFAGITRTYVPLDDDEREQVPPESQRVQAKASDLLDDVRGTVGELLDVTATKEWGNADARADVVVDGEIILTQVPVTYLLFLQKRLDDILEVVGNLPTLEPNETWAYDDDTGLYKSGTIQTLKTRKVPKNHVKAEATERHPAQVDVYHEDVTIGRWSRTLLSGALPQTRVQALQRQVRDLRDAVIAAREEANTREVERQNVAAKVFDFIFA